MIGRIIIRFRLLLALLGLLFLFYLGAKQLFRGQDYYKTETCERIKNQQFSGTITEGYYDENNRGNFKLSIKNSKGIEIYYIVCIGDADKFFHKGDSIVKKTNSFSYVLYKDGDTVEIDCDKDFGCQY